jgi:hypothetical protein
MGHKNTPVIANDANRIENRGTSYYVCIFCRQDYNYAKATPMCVGGFWAGCPHKFPHFHHRCRWCFGRWIEMSSYMVEKTALKLLDSVIKNIGAVKVVDYANQKIAQEVTEA